MITEQCKKGNCQLPGCGYTVGSGMQCDECKRWYQKFCMNLTFEAFNWFSTNSCVWLCQQCYSGANSFLSEAIALVNAAKRSITKRNRDTPSGAHSLVIPIDVKLPHISSESIDLQGPKEERPPSKRSSRYKSSRKEFSSVLYPPNGSQQKTPRKSNRN